LQPGVCVGQLYNFLITNAASGIACRRWDQGGQDDDVVVVANLANRSDDSNSIGFPREGLWKVRFNSDWNGYRPDFGNQLSYDTTAAPPGADNMPSSGNVGIGPYTTIILSQQPVTLLGTTRGAGSMT